MRRHLLPIMRRYGVDLWVIMSRENAPDPVVELFGGHGLTGWYGHRNRVSLLRQGRRRRTRDDVIGTHLSKHLKAFYGTIQSYGEDALKPHLQKYVTERSPNQIAINESHTISMGDGLTAELKAYLLDALGPELAERIVSSEPLPVDYVSVHTPEEDAIGPKPPRLPGTSSSVRSRTKSSPRARRP